MYIVVTLPANKTNKQKLNKKTKQNMLLLSLVFIATNDE